MDLLKVEPGSWSEMCLISSHENEVIDIKAEEGSNAEEEEDEEEEDDPLLIPFTPIKSECEVSVKCLIH
jgi:hypothetical protein